MGRERGFTDSEALAILKAARDYQPPFSANPRTREAEPTTAAKRWTPWLCAYTGARVTEITQLRKEDLREHDGIPFVRVTPEAGTVKTGQYRDVPLHPHLIELGFLAFVASRPAGPLFYQGPAHPDKQHPSLMVATRIGKWVRGLGVTGEVAPNHGWRHRFKTVAIEAGMDARARDAIQGHAARTAGDSYGDVTLKARREAILRHPRYELASVSSQSVPERAGA